MIVRHRYRTRPAGSDEDWSEPRRLRRVMWRIRQQQDRHGGPYRYRRRGNRWARWFTGATFFRFRFRARMAAFERGVMQVQFGGWDGPIMAVLKYVSNVILTRGEQVIDFALSELGTPYRFGVANGPEDPGTDAFDCSGLTQWAWERVGVFLPHSSEAQRLAGNVFNFTNEDVAQPGDLVFMWFPNTRGIEPGHASHVGLWLRRGHVVDTRSQSSPVAIRAMEKGSVIGFGRVQIEGQQQ